LFAALYFFKLCNYSVAPIEAKEKGLFNKAPLIA
jgi:hypothetical protein